jgi:hypothetical protein
MFVGFEIGLAAAISVSAKERYGRHSSLSPPARGGRSKIGVRIKDICGSTWAFLLSHTL